MITPYVPAGTTYTLQLTRALLVYMTPDGSKRLVESREIIPGPDGPEYGAGRVTDAAEVAEILQGDANPLPTLIDKHVLAIGRDEALWWSPAGRRAPFFSKDSSLLAHSGVDVSMPPLLFHVQRKQMSVRALARNRRPDPNTPLYHAPLWNIYRDGHLSTGSMPLPAGPPAGCTESWEQSFWNSAFTTPHHGRVCAHPDGYAAMLEALRTRPRFPTEWLVPTEERLHQWLKTKN